jgi:hypothetical protein
MKAVPVTGHRGPYSCETSRLQHIRDNWFTDGSGVVSFTRWLLVIPRRFLVLISVKSRIELWVIVRLELLGKLKKLNYFKKTRIRDLHDEKQKQR